MLYSRRGCHLCDDALQILQQHGLAVEVVDIDQDADLLAQYNECVPVVHIEGKLRFRGRVDVRLLRRILAHEK